MQQRFDEGAAGLESLKELGGVDVEARSRRLARLVAERAVDEGLADVTYGLVDSPFGPLLVALTPRGLVKLHYPNGDFDRELEGLASKVSPRIVQSAKSTEDVRRQLDEYFDGRRKRFDIPLDLQLTAGFSKRVLTATARIPFGSMATYRDVAGRAGNPLATRAAGNALGSNPVPIVVPCHRVVRTGGGLGGYTGGLDRKRRLLELEGALGPHPRP